MLDHEAPSALIIDDDPTDEGALRLLLEGEGYSVRMTKDTRDGLAILSASPSQLLVLFHVDLTGFTMSGLDSIAVLGARLKDASLARHTYALTTESPHAAELALGRVLTRLAIPIIAKPIVASNVRDALTVVAANHLSAKPRLDGVPA